MPQAGAVARRDLTPEKRAQAGPVRADEAGGQRGGKEKKAPLGKGGGTAGQPCGQQAGGVPQQAHALGFQRLHTAAQGLLKGDRGGDEEALCPALGPAQPAGEGREELRRFLQKNRALTSKPPHKQSQDPSQKKEKNQGAKRRGQEAGEPSAPGEKGHGPFQRPGAQQGQQKGQQAGKRDGQQKPEASQNKNGPQGADRDQGRRRLMHREPSFQTLWLF